MADGTAFVHAPACKDAFGREISYLRLSVTDRCDLRCTYCMAERMQFLPKSAVLSVDELEAIAAAFIAKGIRKIRITGGEPLVRKDIRELIKRLSGHLGRGLDALTLTTNATQLADHAAFLADHGIKRINVSIDSLDPETFAKITRRGQIQRVLDGIEAAQSVGLKIKLNCVALKDYNRTEIPNIIKWAHARDIDVSLIEVMPMGLTGEDRYDQYLPLTQVRDDMDSYWTLTPEAADDPHGGPSRYFRIRETGGRVGFITPLTENFCAGCNRVRVTCTGRIYMCLGQADYIDLRAALQHGTNPAHALASAIDEALGSKPEKHDFDISQRGQAPTLARHMSTTGG